MNKCKDYNCKDCANYGTCKLGVSRFTAKTDNPAKFCPYCQSKLYVQRTDLVTTPTLKAPTGYKEIYLQCRNQECWSVKDKKKRMKDAGLKVMKKEFEVVGIVEVSTKIKIRKYKAANKPLQQAAQA